jgi:hypothetical protein
MDEFPDEQQAIQRLAQMLVENQSIAKSEFTIERLYEAAEPSSLAAMAALLVSLVRNNIVEKIIRVESEGSGGGIQDFKSLMDIPPQIHDWRIDKTVDITKDNLRVIYKVVS